MKARDVFLALFIIALGVFLTYAKTGRLDFVLDGDFEFWFFPSEEFVFEESQEIAAPLPQEIHIINAHGGVEMQGEETDKITVFFKKSIYRKDKDEAQKVADALKMIVNREEPRLILSTNRDEFRRKNFKTYFKILIPAGTDVLVKNSYGLVKAAKTGKTDIANPHGEVQTSDTSGQLIIDNSYEDVSILNALADCQVTSPHSRVTAVNVLGEFLLDNSYGDVELENIEKNVRVNGSHSQVTGKSLKGDVELASSYKKISLTDAGPSIIRGRHCDIEAKGINGSLEITDNYARLRLDDIRGNVKIEGTHMEISAESVLAGEIFISTSYQDVELLNFTGKTTVLLTHGDLVLEPESVTGPIDVQASYAGIRFGWPGDEKFPFEAQTKNGNIIWNLAERPSLEETNGQSMVKAFLTETGKSSIKISTTHGDIRVEGRPRSLKSI
jgi:hypothetical protein